MSGYVRSFEAKTVIDGDEVRVRLKPMKLADVLQLDEVKDNKDILAGHFQKKLSEYIVGITGLTAADGSEVSVAEFLESAYFLEAILDVGTQWIQQATPRNPPLPGA